MKKLIRSFMVIIRYMLLSWLGCLRVVVVGWWQNNLILIFAVKSQLITMFKTDYSSIIWYSIDKMGDNLTSRFPSLISLFSMLESVYDCIEVFSTKPACLVKRCTICPVQSIEISLFDDFGLGQLGKLGSSSGQPVTPFRF